MYDPSICQVLKTDKLDKEIYHTFPYYLYKINDLIPISNEVKKYYNDYLIDYNDEKYLLFKHRFDCDFISDKAFGDNVFVPYYKIYPFISDVQKQIIKEMRINEEELLILKD